MDGVLRLRLLAKDRPGSGPLVAHWAENDAYPYLVRSQSEMIRDHIWCEIHTTWGMEFRTRRRAREERRQCGEHSVVVVVGGDVKILTLK